MSKIFSEPRRTSNPIMLSKNKRLPVHEFVTSSRNAIFTNEHSNQPEASSRTTNQRSEESAGCIADAYHKPDKIPLISNYL